MEMVKLLLQNNTSTYATDESSTPLHAAVKFSSPEMPYLLVEKAADLNTSNDSSMTPLDSALLSIDSVRSAATIIDTAESDKYDSAEIIRQHIAGSAQNFPAADKARIAKVERGFWFGLQYTSVFSYLWFLWHLTWLVAGFALIVPLLERLPAAKLPDWLVLSPVRYLWLVPLTMIPLAFMGFGGAVPSFGSNTSTGILPIPHVLGYYALFFSFGALYYIYDDQNGRISRWWWLALPIGLLVVFPLGMAFTFNDNLFNDEIRRLFSLVLQAVYAWMMTFGLMGLFRKLFSNESKIMRYLSDSSYWLYLAHLPLIITAQMIVREWLQPASVKFVLICVTATTILLLTYQVLVRYTWLGKFLNGPRTRPAKSNR